MKNFLNKGLFLSMKRRRRLQAVPITIGILLLAFLVIILRVFLNVPSQQARAAVEKFYNYEQKGSFSDSWELFHPYMKQKFTKSAFIQDRAHVFIGHFGAETFTYEISKAEEFEKWKPDESQKTLNNGYKVIVTQSYNGKYGKFHFQQEVFVVKYKGVWTILWNYN